MADEIVPVPPNTLELVHPNAEGFKEKIDPKKIEGSVYLFRCSRVLAQGTGSPDPDHAVEVKKCDNPHFRHAGYVKNVIPLMRTQNKKEVVFDNVTVMVCTRCKACYIHVDGQAYDVTEHIDLEAWSKTEEDIHRALGPGGDC